MDGLTIFVLCFIGIVLFVAFVIRRGNKRLRAAAPAPIPALPAPEYPPHVAFETCMNEIAQKNEGDWFYARVAGVSFPNDDGSSRQEVIATLKPFDSLELKHEPDNPYDKNAIQVIAPFGRQIGYLERRLAAETCREVLHGTGFLCFVCRTGSPRDSLGVLFGMVRYYPKAEVEPAAPAPQEIPVQDSRKSGEQRKPSSKPTPASTPPPPLDLSMLPLEFVVFDLETTGLSPQGDEIIEIGAIRVNRNAENHKSFQALVRPENGIPQRITEITGITQQMVDRKGLELGVVLAEFIEFIGDLHLVAFNAAFDIGFLQQAADKHGVRIRNRYTCALKMFRRAWPGLASYRLVDLARMAGLSGDDTHRTLGDCKRTIPIFCSAASRIGEPILWDWPPIDWHVMVKFNEARDTNRAFCAETRPLESADPVHAVTRYTEAMAKMYEYGKLVDGRWGDEHILDRLTLCLWKLGRYQELVAHVDEFVGRSPYTDASTLMARILARREKAVRKNFGALVQGADTPACIGTLLR